MISQSQIYEYHVMLLKLGYFWKGAAGTTHWASEVMMLIARQCCRMGFQLFCVASPVKTRCFLQEFWRNSLVNPRPQCICWSIPFNMVHWKIKLTFHSELPGKWGWRVMWSEASPTHQVRRPASSHFLLNPLGWHLFEELGFVLHISAAAL